MASNKSLVAANIVSILIITMLALIIADQYLKKDNVTRSQVQNIAFSKVFNDCASLQGANTKDCKDIKLSEGEWTGGDGRNQGEWVFGFGDGDESYSGNIRLDANGSVIAISVNQN